MSKAKKIIIAVLSTIFSAVLICLIIFNITPTRAGFGSVTVDNNKGVTIYVSGQYIDKSQDGKYIIRDDCEITLSAVNEFKLFKSYEVKVDGQLLPTTSFDGTKQVAKLQAHAGQTIDVKVNTAPTTSAHKGLSFADPILIKDLNDVMILHDFLVFDKQGFDKIYADKLGNPSDYSLLHEIKLKNVNDFTAYQDFYSKAYFKMADTILLDLTDRYLGIGTAEHPFLGCMDFNNNYFSINLVIDDDVAFNEVPGKYDYNLGVFSTVGSTSYDKPVLIRNASIRGAFTFKNSKNWGSQYTFSAGTLAGISIGDVIYENIHSNSSVSVEIASNINVGGLFGKCKTPIQAWSNISYDGIYGIVSGVTNGDNCSVNSGGLAGLLENSYVNSFSLNASNSTIKANSTSALSGDISTGGFVGKLINNKVPVLGINNIVLSPKQDLQVFASSKNDATNSSRTTKTIASGGIGIIECSSPNKIIIDPLVYVLPEGETDKTELYIEARNANLNSKGNIFAGGMYGFINADSSKQVEFSPNLKKEITIFDAFTNITAEQNGQGQVYAGGLFGFYAFKYPTFNATANEKFVINLNTPNSYIKVKSLQTYSSSGDFNGNSKFGKINCAGFLTSMFPTDASFANFTFTVNNGYLLAEREVGSTAYGPLYAGGLAGYADTSLNSPAKIQNITLNLNNSSVNGLVSTFETDASIEGLNINKFNNNLAVGGFIGKVRAYGHKDNAMPSYGLEDIYINFNIPKVCNIEGMDVNYIAVQGVQNAKGPSDDNATQGYVGGAIGLIDSTGLKNISVKATNQQAIVYFNGTNTPNTSACGGIVGFNQMNYNGGKGGISSSVNIQYAFVDNLHVVARAYCQTQTNPPYDNFAGGIIGVAGYADTSLQVYIDHTFVTNSIVNCIGEEQMKTYSGGIAGGVWWAKGASEKHIIQNSVVVNSQVKASSASYNSAAGGIVGFLNGATIDGCNTFNVEVNAEAYGGSNSWAYVGGIVSSIEGDIYIRNCISASKLYGEAVSKTQVVYGGIAVTDEYRWSGFHVENCLFDIYGLPSTKQDLANDEITVYTQVSGNSQTIKRANDTYSGSTTLEAVSNPSSIEYTNGIYSREMTIPKKGIKNGKTVYPKVWNMSNASKYRVEYLGDPRLYKLDGHNIFRPNKLADGTTNNLHGTVYATLKFTLNQSPYYPSQEFDVCTYPIHLGNDKWDITSELRNDDNDEIISEANTNGYAFATKENGNKKVFFTNTNIGDETKAQNYKIVFNGDCPRIFIYDIQPGADPMPAVDAPANQKLNFYYTHRNQVAVSPSNYNSIVDLGIFYTNNLPDKIVVTPNPEMIRRTIIYIQTHTEDYIFEFNPNYIIGLDVTPSDKTSALGNEGTPEAPIYVFAQGDRVNFNAKAITIQKTSKVKNESNVKFTSPNVPSGVTVATSGAINIGRNAPVGATFTVRCDYVGQLYQGSRPYAEFKIRIKSSITVSDDTTGAIYEGSFRKMLHGQDYQFSVTPVNGYGFNPTKLIINITYNNNSTKIYDLTSQLEYSEDVFEEKPIVIEGQTFNYEFDPVSGLYFITIPQSILAQDVKEIFIETVFPQVYNLVFDKGVTYSAIDKDGRYYVIKLKGGTDINNEILNKVSNEIYVNRFGYELKGYYLTDIASVLENYGDEFKDTCKKSTEGTDVTKINGPMYYYARWTYDVAIETPDNVKVESTLPLSLLEQNIDGDILLVPINTNSKFTFKIIPDVTYVGHPDFQVFSIDEANVPTDITNHCNYSQAAGGYQIDQEVIRGFIYIKIFNDSTCINNGDVDFTETMDSNVTEDGTFTIHYSANYGKAGTTIENTIMYNQSNNFTFKFDTGVEENIIPANTTLRLYRQVNGKPIDAGSYVTGTNTGEASLHDFLDLKTGQPMAKPTVALDPIIYNETYYIVITLPIYSNRVDSNYKDITVSVTGNNYEAPSIVTSYGKASKKYIESKVNVGDKDNPILVPIKPNNGPSPISYTNGIEKFKMYDAFTFDIKASNLTAVSFEVLNNIPVVDKEINGVMTPTKVVKDNRHDNSFFVWQITKDGSNLSDIYNGLVPSQSQFKAKADAGFGVDNLALVGTHALYYVATSGTPVNMQWLVNNGYTIRLIETNNVQAPAADVILWESK